jgi:hypothetical protein
MVQNSITPKLERDRSRPDRRAQQGPLGTGHPFGRRSRGTGLPRSRSAENVQLRVEPNPPATLITSNLHQGEETLLMQYENTQSLCRHHHNAHRYQERCSKPPK